MTDSILILLATILAINAFCAGYWFGKQRTGFISDQPTLCSIKKNRQDTYNKSQISIDDTKFVTDINTNNLEKKYDKLGESTQTSDNISNSVNKLKSMKG